MFYQKTGTPPGGSPERKREVVSYLQASFKVSIKRGCKVINLHRSMWYYEPKKDDTLVIEKLNELAEKLPTRGFDEYYGRIRHQGLKLNRKRVLRVYREMKLSLRRKRKRRLPGRIKEPLKRPVELNKTWSMDFMSDSLSDGRRVRIFNVIDDCNRGALAIESGVGFPTQRVIRVLSQLKEEIGLPEKIRVDNGRGRLVLNLPLTPFKIGAKQKGYVFNSFNLGNLSRMDSLKDLTDSSGKTF